MSWFSKATGIDINLLHPKAATDAAVQATLIGAGKTALENAVLHGQTNPSSAFVSAAGNIVAELKPEALALAEKAISDLLVTHGIASDTAAANVMIEAALVKAGL